VAYAFLADGRDEQQLRQLDMALAPTPEAAQETVDQANMKAMKQLQSMMGGVQSPRRKRA
jgi:O-succinylbenzoate synthase